MSVYFAEKDGLIKIGYSASPAQRARGLHARLLAVMPGERRMERVMHGIFEDYRSHGEWFRAGVRLTTFIEALNGDDNIDACRDIDPTFQRSESIAMISAWNAARDSEAATARPVVVFA